MWTETAITAVDPDAVLTVDGYGFELIGPSVVGLVVSASSAGVLASAPASLVGSFPVVDLEYQIAGATGHCISFSELPAQAEEIISFKPCPESVKDWTLKVTATLSDGSSESADFLLKVHANFNPGRDALKEAVNARRY